MTVNRVETEARTQVGGSAAPAPDPHHFILCLKGVGWEGEGIRDGGVVVSDLVGFGTPSQAAGVGLLQITYDSRLACERAGRVSTRETVRRCHLTLF